MTTRAEHRRAARATCQPGYKIPIMPGLMPHDTPDWRQVAMDQAHEELPQIPGTKVVVYFFKYVEGLHKINEIFGADAVDLVVTQRVKLGYVPAEAIITFATRQRQGTSL